MYAGQAGAGAGEGRVGKWEGRGRGLGVRDTLIEVVQVIEEDEPNVQPAQGHKEGEEEQARPETFTL